MKIGYIRVSTQEQNTIRQEVLMRELGVDEVYIDRMSGKNTNRPELQRMMEYVRRGDTVIVESISRFRGYLSWYKMRMIDFSEPITTKMRCVLARGMNVHSLTTSTATSIEYEKNIDITRNCLKQMCST